jgi:SHS2 domain-containing protein
MSYGKTYEEKFEKELAVIRYAEKMGDREAASRVARREEQIAAESAEDLRRANLDQKGMEMQNMSNTHELGGSRRRKRKSSRRRTTTRKRTKRSRAKRSTKRRRTRGRK